MVAKLKYVFDYNDLLRFVNTTLYYIFIDNSKDKTKYVLEVNHISKNKKHKQYIESTDIYIYDTIVEWADDMELYTDDDTVDLIGYQMNPEVYTKLLYRKPTYSGYELYTNPKSYFIMRPEVLKYLYRKKVTIHYNDKGGKT